jgi:hypothetical protein
MANLPWPVFNIRCIFYGSEATLNGSQLWQAAPPPPPPLQAAPPPLYGNITFTHLDENSIMVKLFYLC